MCPSFLGSRFRYSPPYAHAISGSDMPLNRSHRSVSRGDVTLTSLSESIKCNGLLAGRIPMIYKQSEDCHHRRHKSRADQHTDGRLAPVRVVAIACKMDTGNYSRIENGK